MATYTAFVADALKYVTKSSSSSWSTDAKQGSYSSDSYDYVGAIKFSTLLNTDWTTKNITKIEFYPIYGGSGYQNRNKTLYLYRATRTNIAASTGASLLGSFIGSVDSGGTVKDGSGYVITFSSSSNSSAFSNFVSYLQSGVSNVIALYVKESVSTGTGTYSANYLSITSCSMTIYYEDITAPSTITGAFSDGTVGTYYSDSLTCDGTSPITWSLASGSLPSGLSLSSSGNTCYVRGTPTTAGDYSFGIKASNSAGSTTAYYAMGIASAVTAPSSISYTFANGTVGTAYSDYVLSNGDTPITWSKYSGTLPPGLTLSAGSNSQQGYLKGTPTTAGSYTFTLKATNSGGSITKQFTITISNPSYTITASAGTGGTISPSGSVSVTSGGSKSFTISPSSGYAINYVAVDGTSVGAVTSYQFTNVTSNRTITAYFKKVYTITASAGTGGTISPSGSSTVDSGASKTYTITPNSGYVIDYVSVDGTNVGAQSSYTFSSIAADHTITAYFKATYTITASAGTGGTIEPSGTTTVKSGESLTYTITPNEHYVIQDVVVDSSSKGAISTHTFSNITSNHTIAAYFKSAIGMYIGDKEVLEIYTKTSNSVVKTITGYINKNGTIEVFYSGE